ncbi:MAG: hypothetical protein Ct9H300mP1_14900 [Planctomycetaceae bacterium]|nr:MAG: hypothetical protein Ct9H300mP1_14900 [Planctomycetaceae bacterium]
MTGTAANGRLVEPGGKDRSRGHWCELSRSTRSTIFTPISWSGVHGGRVAGRVADTQRHLAGPVRPALVCHAGRLGVYLVTGVLTVAVGRLLSADPWRAEIIPLLGRG